LTHSPRQHATGHQYGQLVVGFQNATGISLSAERRKLLKKSLTQLPCRGNQELSLRW